MIRKVNLLLMGFFVLLISCTKAQSKMKTFLTEKRAYTKIEIDSVPEIPKGTNERSATFIKKRLESMIGRSMRSLCQQQGLKYPPSYVLYRAFKHEKELEIWAANQRSDTLRLIATIPICAIDDFPSTKLNEGDGKTPEGFFHVRKLYGSSYGFMWIKLTNRELKDFGEPKYGSSFKLCIDYPNAIDQKHTKKHKGAGVSPGSAICLHGNCVSAGCLSFTNEHFLPVFLMADHYNEKRYGRMQIHIFPFRFTDKLINKYKTKNKKIPETDMLAYWANLRQAYDLLNKNQRALEIGTTGEQYTFKQY